ncbi:hypothetical protein DL95DRAFT_71403 [Leptodontidium sp. 2 PMI_412]|nr:hypothetical protein DL95DRAFT_71403 [Leptodontidium sp. 2 PMI_412]
MMIKATPNTTHEKTSKQATTPTAVQATIHINSSSWFPVKANNQPTTLRTIQSNSKTVSSDITSKQKQTQTCNSGKPQTPIILNKDK